MERFGLPGSVTVVGLVYLLALAFAPTPGLSDPGDQTAADAPAVASADGTISSVCPHTAHAEYAMVRLIEAHHASPERPVEIPVGPRPGAGRLIFF